MVNFYRRFLPNCAKVLKPLTDLLKGKPKTLSWSHTATAAFEQTKRLLVAATAAAPLPKRRTFFGN